MTAPRIEPVSDTGRGGRADETLEERRYTPAELGAIAHLYRAEVYRSTIWRTRLDTTTNWSVVTLGIAISISFANAEASPVPLVLVGLLTMFFLMLEARRYLYFNVWRARARWLEKNLYAPMLSAEDAPVAEEWQETLAVDYREPRYHISFARAIGRRLRRSYIWILIIQTVAYLGKIIAHPAPAESLAQVVSRAAIGPIPGELMLIGGVIFIGFWIGVALWTLYLDRVRHGGEKTSVAGG